MQCFLGVYLQANFTSTDMIREMLDQRFNIRHMSVIGHVSHGKTTVTDALVSKAGNPATTLASAGKNKFIDMEKDEQGCCDASYSSP